MLATTISTLSPVPPTALPKRSATASNSATVLAACASSYSLAQALAKRLSSTAPTSSASLSVHAVTKALVKNGLGRQPGREVHHHRQGHARQEDA